MTVRIRHKEYLDVRELEDLALLQDSIIYDETVTEAEKDDAVDTLKALSGWLSDLGYRNKTTADEIADTFAAFSERTNPTLIADSYFTDAIEEYYRDVHGFSEETGSLPVGLVIDWEATAENAKDGYSYGILDGKKYWIRKD